MIVNGKSSLVSMKTRCRRAMELLPEGCADRLGAGASLFAFGLDGDDVLHADAAVAAFGEAAEGQDSVLAEPIDELTSDAQELGRPGGADLVLGAQHHDARAVSDVGEHGSNGGLDLSVAVEAFG